MFEDNIIVDYLTVTFKTSDPHVVLNLLDLSPEAIFLEMPYGYYGYSKCIAFSGIKIYYAGREDMGVCLDMSGTGCRAFESFSLIDVEPLHRFPALFDVLLDMCLQQYEPGKFFCNITRLDIAFNDHSGIFDIDEICEKVEDNEYVSRMTAFASHHTDRGDSVEIGKRGSKLMIRIYDKRRERGFSDETPDEADPGHWIRLEAQFRGDRAYQMLQVADGNVGAIFKNVVANYLRFVEPAADTNKSRWPTSPFWDKFLDGCEPIRIFSSPGVEYNLGRLERLVFGQMGNSIVTALAILGDSEFRHQLRNRRSELTPRQKELLALYESEVDRNRITSDVPLSESDLEFFNETIGGYWH